MRCYSRSRGVTDHELLQITRCYRSRGVTDQEVSLKEKCSAQVAFLQNEVFFFGY